MSASLTVSSAPSRVERHSSALSERQARRFGGVQRSPLAHDHTGAFGSFRRPKLVGVSDTVRASNADLARRAKRAEREWLRSLPKGVRI